MYRLDEFARSGLAQSSCRHWIAGLITCSLILAVSNQVQAALVHHWTLDEDTAAGATSVADVVGGLDGMIQGDVSTVPGRFGNALAFGGPGTDSQVEISDLTTDNLKSTTVAFWINPEQGSVLTPNIKRVISAGDNFEAILDADTGVLANNFYISGGDYPRAPEAVEEGVWTHVAMTSDLSPQGTGDAQIYVNGELVAMENFADDDFAGGTFLFGHRPGQSDNQRYQGLLDDIRIYDTVLSQGEIRALVPEPTTWTLLLLVGLAALPLRRRRR